MRVESTQPVAKTEEVKERVSPAVLDGLFSDLLAQALLKQDEARSVPTESSAENKAINLVNPLEGKKQCVNCGQYRSMLDNNGLCLDCAVRINLGRKYYD